MKKICPRCGSGGPFGRNRSMRDGLACWCKACMKQARIDSINRNEESRERRRNQRAAQTARYLERNPQPYDPVKYASLDAEQRARKSARAAVRYALTRGRVTRPDHCESCGQSCQPQAHHPDYSKPLDVEWLCIPCHGKDNRDPCHQVG